MAISVVLDSNYTLNDGASSTVSFSFDCTGANALFVSGYADASRTWTSITYNSVGLTELWDFAADSGVGLTNGGYMMVSPSSGSNTLTVTYSGVCGGGVVAAALSGVEIGSGVGGAHRTVYTGTSPGSAQPSITATDSQNGDLVIGGCVVFAASITASGSQTSLGEVDNAFGSSSSGDVSTRAATGASTALSWTAATFGWAAAATALIPSGGGGRTTKNTRSWNLGVNVGMGHRMPI